MIRELSVAVVTEGCLEKRKERMKAMREKLKLLILKLIVKCEVESTCAFFKSKVEKRMMWKLRGGTVAFQIEIGRWCGTRERRGCARSVTVGKLRMCTIGYWSALHGITSGSLFWKPWMK